MRYRDRVDAQKRRNPCLSGLSEYLSRPVSASRCRTVALDFHLGLELPLRSDVAPSELDARLERIHQVTQGQTAEKPTLGQLLIVEDISPELIETLGSKLDIDPWFFASYIHRTWRSTRSPTPQNCFLPSRERAQNFLPLYYHKCLSLTGTKPDRNGFLRNCNQHRKLVLIQMAERCAGLAQHDCTVLLKEQGSSWIGLILVDSPIADDYKLSDKTGVLSISIPSVPFLGGPEDFTEHGNCKILTPDHAKSRQDGMLDELVHHWTTNKPTCFDPSRPTLQALSYYPLKVVAAEWVNYISLMAFTLGLYETSDLSNDLQADLNKLSLSIKALQSWRRRVLTSMEKINQILRFTKYHQISGSGSDDWLAIHEDFDFIRTNIQEHADRIESMVPVVTSFIQLIESRRALLETGNVTRLTVLAIIFIPLSYIASIFSMAERYGPGGPKFWVYFTVALPITALILFLATAPWSYWRAPRLPKRLKRFFDF